MSDSEVSLKNFLSRNTLTAERYRKDVVCGRDYTKDSVICSACVIKKAII
jgi:hypothetical protein